MQAYNVLIKGTTAINICSNPLTCSVAICGKINPTSHTHSQMTELIHNHSVFGNIFSYLEQLLGGDLHILVCVARSRVWSCAGVQRAVPYPKCLTFRSRAKCPARAPLSKTLHPAQPHSLSCQIKASAALHVQLVLLHTRVPLNSLR